MYGCSQHTILSWFSGKAHTKMFITLTPMFVEREVSSYFLLFCSGGMPVLLACPQVMSFCLSWPAP
jgi:hypothetical protein